MCFDSVVLKKVLSFLITNFLELSTDIYGLCVIKKLIFTFKDKEVALLIRKKMIDNIICLVHSSFGNYTIQMALDTWERTTVEPIIQAFYGHFFYLSVQKYSSNVIERCLELGSENVLSQYVEEICDVHRVLGMINN